jgi:carbon-monoxide dehydrogenase large subunit
MRFVGQRVARVEDHRLLTGRGRYVDDLQLPRMLHVAFVRSPFAHARLVAIDTTAAAAAPGVVAILTGEQLAAMTEAVVPSVGVFGPWPTFHALATDRVRHVGDPVVMIVASGRAEAEDACELVEVGYEPLPPVVTAADAIDPQRPSLFDDLDGNVMARNPPLVVGDVDAVFARADHVVTATLRQQRIANSPMETRGALADFDPSSGHLTFHTSTQNPHGVRAQLAATLDQPLDRIRVVAHDVGGGFGLKGNVHREDFCVAAASRALGRPVKWVEDRNEHLLASGHAREETVDARIAVDADGTILGLDAAMTMCVGAYPNVPFSSTMYPHLVQTYLPGPYRMTAYRFSSTVVATNKATYTAYRGPWAVETWVRERLLDLVAAELGIDPAEIRRRNLVDGAPDDRLVTGLSLAGVSSSASLDRALELVDYEGVRAEQERVRIEGRTANGADRALGIGFATFIEAAPGPAEGRPGGGPFFSERARAFLAPDGRLVVATPQMPHGQGHETTLAQVAADELGVRMEDTRVVFGDTDLTPHTVLGTGGSRAATWASGAVLMATRTLKEQVLAVASAMLEIAPEDLEVVDGSVRARGAPTRAASLREVAQRALADPGTLPDGTVRLDAEEQYTGTHGITGSGWSGGTHACVVEVDRNTGRVHIRRYVVVEDCGRVVNPAIVEGQIHGGVAQGIGQVLYEHAAYDADGNFLTGSFLDYLLPTMAEIPAIEIEHLETGADGEVDFRGVGEGGMIVAPAALTNAVADALEPWGARVTEMYLPPETVLRLAGVLPGDPPRS